MSRKADNKTNATLEKKKKKAINYCLPENPVEFYLSEETTSYGDNGKKPFNVYYDNTEPSVRLHRVIASRFLIGRGKTVLI